MASGIQFSAGAMNRFSALEVDGILLNILTGNKHI